MPVYTCSATLHWIPLDTRDKLPGMDSDRWEIWLLYRGRYAVYVSRDQGQHWRLDRYAED
jgi:hypothetical protein